MYWIVILIAVVVGTLIGFTIGIVVSAAKTGPALAAALLNAGFDAEEAQNICQHMQRNMRGCHSKDLEKTT